MINWHSIKLQYLLGEKRILRKFLSEDLFHTNSSQSSGMRKENWKILWGLVEN